MCKKVSVIITTYKRAVHLNRAINSVLNQDYKNIELIVVDDNDEESNYRNIVENIVSKYKINKNFKYIKHRKNKNGAAARNTGISVATGDYITFLDDDDEFFINRISILVNEMEKEENKKYGAIYSNVEIVYDDKVEYLNDISVCRNGNLKKELLLEKFTIGTGSNLFIRNEIMRKLTGFDTQFKRHQDWEFLIRFFRVSIIKYHDNVLVKKFMDSRINYPNSYVLEEVKKLYLEKFKYDIQEYGNYIEKKIIEVHMKELIVSYLNDGRIKAALNLKKNK